MKWSCADERGAHAIPHSSSKTQPFALLTHAPAGPTLRDKRNSETTVKRPLQKIRPAGAKANNGKLMLEDPSTRTSFALDNQKLAKKHAGKNVVATGTLGEANDILHVRKIELAA